VGNQGLKQITFMIKDSSSRLSSFREVIIEICKRLDKSYTAPRCADMWNEDASFEYCSRKEE